MKTEPPRKISFEMPPPQEYKILDNPADEAITAAEDQTSTELKLTGVKLDAAKKLMTGEIEVSLTPDEPYVTDDFNLPEEEYVKE